MILYLVQRQYNLGSQCGPEYDALFANKDKAEAYAERKQVEDKNHNYFIDPVQVY